MAGRGAARPDNRHGGRAVSCGPHARRAPLRLSVAIYAAYGSNMDPAQMARALPAFTAARHRLAGRLAADVRRRGSGLGGRARHGRRGRGHSASSWCCTRCPRPTRPRSTAGTASTLGYYRKSKVRVSTLDGDVVAWLYVLNDYEGGLPSARYLGIMADAAEAAGAPVGLRRRAAGQALRVGRQTDPSPRPRRAASVDGRLRSRRRPSSEVEVRAALGSPGGSALGPA